MCPRVPEGWGGPTVVWWAYGRRRRAEFTPKIQGAAVFSSVWSKAKLRLEIAREQGFQPIRG